MQNETGRPTIISRALLLLGPTGAGKTPLGEIIEQRGLWDTTCLHFDFGANLREVVRRNRPDQWISRQDIEFLTEVLRSGALLENEHFPIAERILQSFAVARNVDERTCIVLNGLPRHVGQARAIDALLKVKAVVHLRCSCETVFQRIHSNVGGDRTDRIDDDREAIRKKLAIFDERTAPLLDHYTCQNAQIETIEVTAQMTPTQMWEILNQRRKQPAD